VKSFSVMALKNISGITRIGDPCSTNPVLFIMFRTLFFPARVSCLHVPTSNGSRRRVVVKRIKT